MLQLYHKNTKNTDYTYFLRFNDVIEFSGERVLVGGAKVLLPSPAAACCLCQFAHSHKNLLHSCGSYENIVHVIDYISITGALVVPASV